MADPSDKKIKLRVNKSSKKPRNTYTTKRGTQIKLHSNFQSRWKAKRDVRARKRAAYLATMPKSRFKRILFRMHPKRVAKYWFSREGGLMALKLGGVGILAVFLLLIGVFAYFRKDLPNLHDISGNNIGGSNRYYDRSGKTLLWEDFDAVKRNPIRGEGVPDYMKNATIAIEDKDFFKHGGFDLKGITRAGVNNITGKSGTTQGGSTITQQLVKLTQNWTKERTYARKIKELILSVELERRYSKKEILDGYLDTAPYGDITYGVEAAMQDYFNKSAKKITLDEAAFLAAIPKSPSVYSKYGSSYDKKALEDRQDYILDLMAEQGYISNDERDKAKKVETTKKIKPRVSRYANIKAPWFVLTAKEKLIQEGRGESVRLGGLKITTTLDMDKQKLAEDQVKNGMVQVGYQGGDAAAFVAEEVKTGQVVALVGGPDFSNKEYGENNYARRKLPPGSSFKPYDYLSLLENTDQFGAGSVLYDSQDPLPGHYDCTNKARPPNGNCLYDYDFRYPGPMTLRYSLGGSRNVPAVKAMLIAGVDKTIDTAGKLGLKDTGNDRIEGNGYKCYKPTIVDVDNAGPADEAQCGGSAAIGDGAYLKLDEHVHAFATISRNGKNVPQTYWLKIEDASGRVVPGTEWKQTEGKQVVREDSAYIVADMIEDPNASYMGNKSHRYNGWKFGFKTGTTNDSKDGWMMGESTKYAAGVWVGYHNRTRELSGFMETMTQPIVSGWMQKAHDGLQPEERPRPKGIQTMPAFVVRSHVGVASVEPSPANDLYPSWYKKATRAGNATIDKVSKKLATDCTPERAKMNAYNAIANNFSGDKFHAGYIPSQRGGSSEKDDVHKCEDAKPDVSLSAPSSCSSSCTFTARVRQGTHPISSGEFPGTVNFYVDGKLIRSANVGSSPATISAKYSVRVSGTKTVKAEVIDSVLYDSSDSQSVSFSGPDDDEGESSSITITKAEIDGLETDFEWDGGNGEVTIRRVDDDSEICSHNGNNCSGIAPPGTPVYAEDEDGNVSTPFTVTGP